MNQPLTIPIAPLEHPAMDFAFLRREGIRHLERMAGRHWTDFNTHDPGITILEQLCYALTDLGYRIAYEVPDLLTKDGEQTYGSMYSPGQILTSNPVTLTDLRKMMIDIAGVKNAWVERAAAQDIPLYYYAGENALSLQQDALTGEPVFLKGLHRVVIEISDLLYTDGTDEQIDNVRKEVVRRLHSYRGLCEDFESIDLLAPQGIKVSARVEIDAVDDAEAILLEIFQKAADYISPPVRFSSLGQLLESGKRVDEIFDGPLLEHGFIDSDVLKQAQRRSDIRTSDLIHEIMDVPGVRAVRSISVSTGIRPEKWSLTLDSHMAPKLDLSESNIVLERNRLPASVDGDAVIDAYYERLRHSAAFQLRKPAEREIHARPGRDRNLGRYHSIQHQFPATYGIGEMGLPGSASPERKAQAKQIKAYLMFFDQLLANYFSQLAHVRDLFSFSSPTPTTYFSEMIDDASLGIDDIRKSETAEHRARLQQITENPDASPGTAQVDLSRQNRFLNHLMSRFAEQFTDYSLVLYGAMPQSASISQKIIRDKQVFLQDYPRVSRGRGTAFDFLTPHGNDNVSGLEQRIRRKLGLVAEEDEFFFIIEHILLRPMEGDENQLIPLLDDTQSRDPYSLQLSFVFPNWPQRFNEEQGSFRQFIGRTIREETPAHLIPYVHWFDRSSMTAFEAGHRDWVDNRRSYLKDKLGI